MEEKVLAKLEEMSAKAEENRKVIEAKHAEQVAELNEKLAKQGATLGEIKAEVDEVKKQNGKLKVLGAKDEQNFKSAFAAALKNNYDAIKDGRGSFKMEGASFDTKAVGDMTLGVNLTGSGVAQYNLQPALRGRRAAQLRDFLEIVPSATGIWKYYRQNSPVGEGSFGVQTEGAAKAQIDYDVTEKTVNVAVIAGYSRISSQMLRDLPFMQSFLPNELQEDYYRSETNKFINDMMAELSAYTTTATVYAEKCIEWIAAIYARDYNASNILTTASNWATLLTTKPADYSFPGGVTITASGEVAIAGVPVSILNGMTGTKTFVGDSSRAKIIQSAGLNVRFFEQDSDNVQKNLITVRAESEVALAVLRPDAFLYV